MKVLRVRVMMEVTVDLPKNLNSDEEISGAVKGHFEEWLPEGVEVLEKSFVDPDAEDIFEMGQ